MSNPWDSSKIAGGATPTGMQPYRDASAQSKYPSHPVNQYSPTSSAFTMPNTNSFTPGPASPLPKYSASHTASGAYPYMLHADAAQGPTQSSVPNTSPFTPSPMTPSPIYSASDTAPGAHPYMPRADAAQGPSQGLTPWQPPAAPVLYVPPPPPRKSRRMWPIYCFIISLIVLTIVGVVVGVLVTIRRAST